MNKKTVFSTIAFLIIGILVLTGCAAPKAAIPATPVTNLRTMSVSGTGKVTLVPNVAYINIGVHSEAPDVSASLQTNNDLAESISAALQAEGVEPKDIQTANFNVYPMQKYDEMGQISGTVYSVDNTVYVTVRNLDNLGSLLDKAIKAGANNIYGISFDISDREAALAQARNLAIQDAKAKAVDVASVSGVTVGQIQSINVSGTNYNQPYYSGYGLGGGGMAALDTSVPVSSGQIVITYEAVLVFEIN